MVCFKSVKFRTIYRFEISAFYPLFVGEEETVPITVRDDSFFHLNHIILDLSSLEYDDNFCNSGNHRLSFSLIPMYASVRSFRCFFPVECNFFSFLHVVLNLPGNRSAALFVRLFVCTKHVLIHIISIFHRTNE